MIGAPDPAAGRSISGTLRAALLGLTVLLAIVGAIGVGALYEARQRYEDRLAAAYALEVASANALAAEVALESNLARPRSRSAALFVRSAARSYVRAADRVRRLAAGDGPSRALLAPLAAARRPAAALARSPTEASARAEAALALPPVRGAVERLAARQRERRERARAAAASASRTALVAIVLGAGLALAGALASLTLLITAMRRPLDDLVDATRRMAAGDLGARVRTAGPRELAALAAAFNSMGEELAGARARVESQRERLDTTIRSLGDGLVICDDAGRVTSLNPRAGELMPGLRVGGAAHGPGGPLPALSEALAGEVTVDRERDRTLAVTAARLAGPEGGTVWTLRDITERARLEQAKSDFVATASHELRSPLTSIKGFVELLQAGGDNLTDRQREFLAIVLDSTDRLVELVAELLDIARIESGQYEINPRSVDLRETVEEVAAMLAPRLQEKRQRLELRIAEPRPPALADPARIRQVLTNLVTNAHQYTGEGGTIAVALEGDARATAITVSDNGRGMSADDARAAFERFRRGGGEERASAGTGLGLSIVRSLVELHGGSVELRSQLGEGSTFVVRLPAAAAPAPAQPATSGAAAGAGERRGARPRRVLVVDDEPALAALISEQLRPLGCEAVRAGSGAEALARLRSERFDAMTLDVLMPGMSGFDVLREVRSDPRLRDLPVIFVSVMARAPELAGEWVVPKPIEPGRLVEVLEAAIEARRSRVLVLAPDALRADVEPALAALGADHRWETTVEGAVRAGSEQPFEVALVHASMASARPAVDGSALRGNRRGRAVVLFASDGEGGPGEGAGVGMPVLGVAQAVGVLRSLLGGTREPQG